MKKIIALILIVCFPAALIAETIEGITKEDEDMDWGECYYEGEQMANEYYDSNSWFMWGIVGGFLGGILGGTVAVVASSSDVTPPMTQVKGLDDNCKQAFYEGYNKKAKSKKRSSTIGGAVLGTVAIVAVVLVAMSGD